MLNDNRPESLAGYPVVIALPVQWGDQDAFGHVNNTVYLRWCESARVEYFLRVGLSMSPPDSGTGPILANIACDYHRPVTYPDRVWIGARVTRIGNSSFVMEHGVFSEAMDAVAATVTSAIVVLDYGRGKPVRVPEAIRQAIGELEGKVFEGAPR